MHIPKYLRWTLIRSSILSVARHTSADDDNIILPLFIPRSSIRTDASTDLVEVGYVTGSRSFEDETNEEGKRSSGNQEGSRSEMTAFEGNTDYLEEVLNGISHDCGPTNTRLGE